MLTDLPTCRLPVVTTPGRLATTVLPATSSAAGSAKSKEEPREEDIQREEMFQKGFPEGAQKPKESKLAYLPTDRALI